MTLFKLETCIEAVSPLEQLHICLMWPLPVPSAGGSWMLIGWAGKTSPSLYSLTSVLDFLAIIHNRTAVPARSISSIRCRGHEVKLILPAVLPQHPNSLYVWQPLFSMEQIVFLRGWNWLDLCLRFRTELWTYRLFQPCVCVCVCAQIWFVCF